ncbi:MAG: hypothetical protein WD069_16995 [Planctomycetales bacterium]
MASKLTAVAVACLVPMAISDGPMAFLLALLIGGLAACGLLTSFQLIGRDAEQDGPMMKWLLVVPLDIALLVFAIGIAATVLIDR